MSRPFRIYKNECGEWIFDGEGRAFPTACDTFDRAILEMDYALYPRARRKKTLRDRLIDWGLIMWTPGHG